MYELNSIALTQDVFTNREFLLSYAKPQVRMIRDKSWLTARLSYTPNWTEIQTGGASPNSDPRSLEQVGSCDRKISYRNVLNYASTVISGRWGGDSTGILSAKMKFEQDLQFSDHLFFWELWNLGIPHAFCQKRKWYFWMMWRSLDEKTRRKIVNEDLIRYRSSCMKHYVSRFNILTIYLVLNYFQNRKIRSIVQ